MQIIESNQKLIFKVDLIKLSNLV